MAEQVDFRESDHLYGGCILTIIYLELMSQFKVRI